jgi:hypothetical protein
MPQPKGVVAQHKARSLARLLAKGRKHLIKSDKEV